MVKPLISLVAIISQNRVLANTLLETSNHIPWRIPSDLKRFQEITMRHPVILGRTTFETMKSPLKNRTNIIVTRNQNYQAFGCPVLHSVDEAIKWAAVSEKEEIFIIGGAQIYSESLPLADRLYLTIVEGDSEGDVLFPEYQNIFTKVLFEENREEDGFKFKFIDLGR
jgi:dihydrofolate reductase